MAAPANVTRRLLPHSYPFSSPALDSAQRCLGASFVIGLVLAGLRSAVAAVDGYFLGNATVIGFLRDPSVYTNFVFGVALLGYYLWLPHGIDRLLSRVRDNDILRAPLAHRGWGWRTVAESKSARTEAPGGRDAGDDWTRPVLQELDVAWIPWAGGVVGIAIAIWMWFHYAGMPPGLWFTAGAGSRVTAALWAGFLMALLVSVLLTCTVVILKLHRLFKGGANIRPLHPDGVGGLAPMADFALSMVYMISAVGVMLLAITPFTRGLASGGRLTYTWSPDLGVAAFLYLVISPLIFFLVLESASKAMSESKREQLARIGDRWDAEYPATLQAVEQGDEELSPRVERLRTIRELYQQVQGFPVWPFDGASLRKFGGSFLSPLFIGVLVELIKNVLTRPSV
jgi:hypothetical protein